MSKDRIFDYELFELKRMKISRYDAMLIQAVGVGDKCQALQLCKDFGADANASGTNGETSCHLAVACGDMEMVKILLKLGADVNKPSDSIVGGYAPLHYAIERELIDVATFLLENGANVNLLTQKSGFTPLIMTARRNDVKMAQILLKFGAITTLKDKNGFTASYWATSRGFDTFVTELDLPVATAPSFKHVAASLEKISLPSSKKKKAKKSKGKKKK